METKHIVTQLVLAGLAGAAVWWAVSRHRALKRRIPLSHGVELRQVGLALLCIVATVPLFYAVVVYELVPKGSPAAFASMLALSSVACVASMIAIVNAAQMRWAKGWLTLVDETTVRIEAEGDDRTITLRPGSVVVAAIEGKPQWLQFTIIDDDVAIHLFAMVPIKHLGLAPDGAEVEPRGMMLGHSAAFCTLVAPFVRHASQG